MRMPIRAPSMIASGKIDVEAADHGPLRLRGQHRGLRLRQGDADCSVKVQIDMPTWRGRAH